MKTGYVRRLGPGPDPVRPQGPVHQAAGPGPYLHGAGPTISGPDPRTSLWGPVRSEVRKGQDQTADSLGLICELWLTCHWIALDDSDIQIIKTYASLGVTIVGSCLRSHMYSGSLVTG